MTTTLLPPDEETALTTYFRAALAGTQWESALVSNRLTRRGSGEEVAPDADFAVIVRGDGGPALEPPTFLRRAGIRIFGPDGDDNGVQTGALARYLAALLPVTHLYVDSVAATRAVHGPHRVAPTLGRPENYVTCDLVFVGTPITIGRNEP